MNLAGLDRVACLGRDVDGAVRDGKAYGDGIHTGEIYDLVIVGAGMAGLNFSERDTTGPHGNYPNR